MRRTREKKRKATKVTRQQRHETYRCDTTLPHAYVHISDVLLKIGDDCYADVNQ
jgi:hypothetical protein